LSSKLTLTQEATISLTLESSSRKRAIPAVQGLSGCFLFEREEEETIEKRKGREEGGGKSRWKLEEKTERSSRAFSFLTFVEIATRQLERFHLFWETDLLSFFNKSSKIVLFEVNATRRVSCKTPRSPSPSERTPIQTSPFQSICSLSSSPLQPHQPPSLVSLCLPLSLFRFDDGLLQSLFFFLDFLPRSTIRMGKRPSSVLRRVFSQGSEDSKGASGERSFFFSLSF